MTNPTPPTGHDSHQHRDTSGLVITLCPAWWARNRGVHCILRHPHDDKQHTNGVVHWPDSEVYQ